MLEFPSPQKIKQELPLQPEEEHFIAASRDALQRILSGKDPRKLLILGPCSIHDLESCLEYAQKCKTLFEKVSDRFFCIMRAYVEKPRSGNSWRGLICDPHLNATHDIHTGLALSRRFLLELAQLKVPAATEFVTPAYSLYIEDLITWGCIGARTSSSQIHRLLASHLPMPIGIKNTIDGNVHCAASGIAIARCPQTFLHINDAGKLSPVKSKGNPHAHLVLRGALNGPNYTEEPVNKAISLLRQMELPPKLIIDCSHGNSGRQYFKQKQVFQEVFEMGQEEHIIGLMLESHLEAGRQKIPSSLSELQRGVSITDSCLDFHSTEELILSSLCPVLSS